VSGRDAAGRFASGFSPDYKHGPQPSLKRAGMSAHLASSIMEIANLPVKIREPGHQRRRTVSLFGMMVLRLALGQSSRRRSVLPFIRLVIRAAAIAGTRARLPPAPTPPSLPDRVLSV